MAKRKRAKEYKEYLEHVEKIKQLFAKADKKKLEKALKSGNRSEFYKALGVSKKELDTLLKTGQKLALDSIADLFKK